MLSFAVLDSGEGHTHQSSAIHLVIRHTFFPSQILKFNIQEKDFKVDTVIFHYHYQKNKDFSSSFKKQLKQWLQIKIHTISKLEYGHAVPYTLLHILLCYQHILERANFESASIFLEHNFYSVFLTNFLNQFYPLSEKRKKKSNSYTKKLKCF